MSGFAELDSLLRGATRSVAPAIVCRIEQHGAAIYEAAFGQIHPGLDSPPISTGCLFDLASVTKLFTTTAALRLCTDGAWSLDMAVADVLPEFAGRRAIGATEDPVTKRPVAASGYWLSLAPVVQARTVTIRHLLTHTSGLPAWRNVFSLCGDAPGPGYSLSRTEVLHRQSKGFDAICAFDFAYPPGLSYTYSDVGLMLLGGAVARAHGSDSLDLAIGELVNSPLGMDACFNPPTELVDGIAPTEYCPWRARRLFGEVHDENAAGLGGIAGHAGLFGNAKDLCRLARLYLRNGEGHIAPKLVRESLRCQIGADAPGTPLPDPQHPCAMTNPYIRRGLGWVLTTPGASCGPSWSRNGFGHTGFTGISLWCDPDHGLAVALLTNRVYRGRDPEPVQRLRVDVHEWIARAILMG